MEGLKALLPSEIQKLKNEILIFLLFSFGAIPGGIIYGYLKKLGIHALLSLGVGVLVAFFVGGFAYRFVKRREDNTKATEWYGKNATGAKELDLYEKIITVDGSKVFPPVVVKEIIENLVIQEQCMANLKASAPIVAKENKVVSEEPGTLDDWKGLILGFTKGYASVSYYQTVK
jgi:hypothetical protein